MTSEVRKLFALIDDFIIFRGTNACSPVFGQGYEALYLPPELETALIPHRDEWVKSLTEKEGPWVAVRFREDLEKTLVILFTKRAEVGKYCRPRVSAPTMPEKTWKAWRRKLKLEEKKRLKKGG